MTSLFLRATAALFLLLGCLWQAHSLGRGTSPPTQPVAVQHAEPDAGHAKEVPELQKAALSDFPQTIARPLFFEERQFPRKAEKIVEAPAPKSAPAVPAPVLDRDLKLLGVQIVEGNRKALIATGDSEAEWMSVGAAVGGWQIDGVEAEAVTLKAGDVSLILRLYNDQND